MRYITVFCRQIPRTRNDRQTALRAYGDRNRCLRLFHCNLIITYLQSNCNRFFLFCYVRIVNYRHSYFCEPYHRFQHIRHSYSHGAALAVLCHEYVWYNRPDLRDRICGYGFGCPRVFWGFRTKKRMQRWKRFTVIRNVDDIVTHVPLAIWGYSHVGSMIKIGEKGKYSPVDAHRPENIMAELERREN